MLSEMENRAVKPLNINLVEDWLKFADVSEQSAKTYNKSIRRFFVYLQTNNIATPTADTVHKWKESMKAEGKAPATINQYLTATKLFFKFLNQRGLYSVDISHIKGCKLTSEHKRDALTAAQGRQVLKSFDTSTLAGLRDKAMTALMMCCGLRTIEVSRANIGDLVKTYGRTALFVQGKGRTDRRECVMIPAQVEKMINEYLQARGDCDKTAPLFASIGNRNKGGRLVTDTIRRTAEQSFRNVGINSKRLTAHSLRHSAASIAFQLGVSLRDIQRVLRHRTIQGTLTYVHVEDSQPIMEKVLCDTLIERGHGEWGDEDDT